MFSDSFRQSNAYQLLIFSLFVLFAIIAGWPILSDLDGVIIGRDNDVFINPWADWWTRKALTDPALTLWRTDYMFYPVGANLSYHSFSHLNTAVSLLLRPLFGDLPAYNLSIWLNYPLIGFGMYKLARYLTASDVSGVLAGIAFAFSSHAMYQSSHPVLLSIWCFPLATLYYFRAVEEENKGLALVAALFVLLGTLTSTLLFFMMVLWFAFLTTYLWVAPGWKRPSLPLLLTFALASGITTTIVQLPLIFDAIANQNSSFIISEAHESIVADILSPIVPHWFIWFSRGLYFGFVGIYIMLFARRSGGKLRLWVVLLIVTYLIGIGPKPLLLGNEINVTLPWSYPFVPILRNMYRFNILTSLAVSVLIAYGWIGIRAELKTARARQVGAVIVTILLFTDYAWPQIPTVTSFASPFYHDFLDEVPDTIVLAHLPTHRQFDKRYLYYQTIHGHKIINGVISRAEADTFSFVESNALFENRADDRPSFLPPPKPDLEAALNQLANTGVGYLIIEKSFMKSGQIAIWKSSMEQEPVYEDGAVVVYEVTQ